MEDKIINLESIKKAKADFRKVMKSEISAFASDEQKVMEASQKASALFLQSEFYKNASLIFAFISAGSEIPVMPVIQKALHDKKQVAVPRIISGTNLMEFYFLENAALDVQTEKGSYGILEPKQWLKKLDVNSISQNAVMLLPGLAFSKDGKRLGKGKGFYDIFLERLLRESKPFLLTGKKIGYCYSVQIQNEIPFCENDVSVDYVISENGIINCKDFRFC